MKTIENVPVPALVCVGPSDGETLPAERISPCRAEEETVETPALPPADVAAEPEEVSEKNEKEVDDHRVEETESPDISDYIPRQEAEKKIREAYLRGRREKVEAYWGGPVDRRQAPDAGGGDPAASLFQLRRSVWG